MGDPSTDRLLAILLVIVAGLALVLLLSVLAAAQWKRRDRLGRVRSIVGLFAVILLIAGSFQA